ncbi:hypothetical protein [Marininema halotolerans]|uniref:Uncharacterized protein n=1 Tax=Marininema halotolerans TaxID=1155944 RepID=A0A1I6TYU3_9BACL|nr:hypothetical protein [Marininema halotolerans]SFS94409.1 hypothetical protein SAMN05444972_11233 [Marininema halotolerans]
MLKELLVIQKERKLTNKDAEQYGLPIQELESKLRFYHLKNYQRLASQNNGVSSTFTVPSSQPTPAENGRHLPESYGINALGLLAYGSTELFAFWEWTVSWNHMKEMYDSLSKEEVHYGLYLYRMAEGFSDMNQKQFVRKIDVSSNCSCYIISDLETDHLYRASLELQRGEWTFPILHSPCVRL